MMISCNLMANAATLTNTNDTTNEYDDYIILYTINITEDAEDFIVPITDNRSRSIYHLNVSLSGNKTAKTVTATVKNDFALGFSTVSVTLKLYSYRSSAVLRASKYDNDLNLGESISVTVSTNNQTAKYYAVLTGTGNGEKCRRSNRWLCHSQNLCKIRQGLRSICSRLCKEYERGYFLKNKLLQKMTEQAFTVCSVIFYLD